MATSGNRKKFLIGGAIAFVLLLVLAYYFIFVHDDIAGNNIAPTSQKAASQSATIAEQYFATTRANIRDKATIQGSEITGTLERGEMVTGKVIMGEDGESEWLEFLGGKGFIAKQNLSDIQPPVLTKLVADKIWITDGATDIWAAPDTSSSLIDRVSEGSKLTIAGLTGNDYLEIKLSSGGVGYIIDGARILKLLEAKPVAIAFNPDKCSFGSEIDGMFAQLGSKIRSEYEAIENREYPSEEARERALGSVEGKSHFRKLQRSYKGLSITGIAQHYESQSLYFADQPAKVISVFRKSGFKIDRQGQFASTDLYAGISATNRYSAAFGTADLGCGV